MKTIGHQLWMAQLVDFKMARRLLRLILIWGGQAFLGAEAAKDLYKLGQFEAASKMYR